MGIKRNLESLRQQALGSGAIPLPHEATGGFGTLPVISCHDEERPLESDALGLTLLDAQSVLPTQVAMRLSGYVASGHGKRVHVLVSELVPEDPRRLRQHFGLDLESGCRPRSADQDLKVWRHRDHQITMVAVRKAVANLPTAESDCALLDAAPWCHSGIFL